MRTINMTEFTTEKSVDISVYRQLSPMIIDQHCELEGSFPNTDLEDIKTERGKSENVLSEEYKQNMGLDLELEEDEPERETRLKSPENSSKTDSADPDVKPTHSYIALIAMAILSNPSKKMILGDIYHYISENFPYYRNKDKSWRNSIRHNLSLNECFIKAGRSENGKGNYWAIHPANVEDFANGDFRRRRARRRVRRSNSLKFGGSSSAYFRGLGSISTHPSFFPYRTDDCRLHPSLPTLTYVRPAKKSFAIDSIMGSYDFPYLYSPISVRSYPSVGLHGSRDYSAASTLSSAYHNSPLASYVSGVQTNASAGYTVSSDSSAFSAYLGSKPGVVSRGQNSIRSESWQETLTKLRQQLRKEVP